MQYITGLSRQQLQISSLEDKIALDNPVRFIEAFVEYISLEALVFTAQQNRTINPLDILSQNFTRTPKVLTACNRFQLVRRGGFNTSFTVRSPRRTQRNFNCWRQVY